MPSRKLFLLLCASLSWSASYHFAADGDDTRSAILAASEATPWKTLTKLGSVTLQPGDSVLLRKGDVWRESLAIKQSGTASLPIVVTRYGNASTLPELRGTILATGTPIASGMAARIPGGMSVAAVFASSARVRCSRFPDTGWTIAPSFEGDSVLTVPALAGKDWVGASIHVRTAMWTLETHRIKSQQGSRAVLDGKSVNALQDSLRLFVSNHPTALPATEGWAFANTDSTLRWTGSTPTVEAAVVPTLLDLSNRSHVRVIGLKFFGSTAQAIKLGGTGIVVENCEIDQPGLVGIRLAGREANLSGNRITGAANGAMAGSGNRHRIETNHIRRTALLADLGPDGMGNGCCGGRAIDFSGDSNTVSRNSVDSSGYIGIGFRGRSTLIEENEVAHSCMTTDDCGGIYTWTGKFLDSGSEGSIIRRNFVRDPVGAPSGWKHPWEASQGIYLDDGTHDVSIDSNVVSGNVRGIFLHNNRRCLVRDNVAFGNLKAQVAMSHDGLAGAGDMIDNRIEGNLLVALPGQGMDVEADIHQAQTVPMASLSNNILCSDQGMSARCLQDGTLLWRKEAVVADDPRLGPEAQLNGRFDSTRLTWSSWPSEAILSLDSGSPCLTGKCLKMSYLGDAAKSPLANCSRSVATTNGQAWRLSFRARALNPGQHISPTFRRDGGDYAVLGFTIALALDTQWTSHSFLFRASQAEAKARLDFHNSRKDSVYWLDDVSLRSVPDSIPASLPTARLLANPTPDAVSSSLSTGSWMDAWGTILNSATELLPWQGRVAFPYTGWIVGIAQRTASSSTLVAVRQGNLWTFRGLTAPARIVDIRGCLLASLQPDAQGNATWNVPASTSLSFLHTAGQSRALFSPR